ncbi:hypothetical protein [Streptomyces sp. NPDC029721]|uniref:hypothetical protein n=1 Tax=unclassified Streptomyces TaxID=2593676 RepID=UPI0033FEAC6F
MLAHGGADALDRLGVYGAGLAVLALVTALIGVLLKEPASRQTPPAAAAGAPEPVGKTG